MHVLQFFSAAGGGAQSPASAGVTAIFVARSLCDLFTGAGDGGEGLAAEGAGMRGRVGERGTDEPPSLGASGSSSLPGSSLVTPCCEGPPSSSGSRGGSL